MFGLRPPSRALGRHPAPHRAPRHYPPLPREDPPPPAPLHPSFLTRHLAAVVAPPPPSTTAGPCCQPSRCHSQSRMWRRRRPPRRGKGRWRQTRRDDAWKSPIGSNRMTWISCARRPSSSCPSLMQSERSEQELEFKSPCVASPPLTPPPDSSVSASPCPYLQARRSRGGGTAEDAGATPHRTTPGRYRRPRCARQRVCKRDDLSFGKQSHS